jgi:hypothetical protein
LNTEFGDIKSSRLFSSVSLVKDFPKGIRPHRGCAINVASLNNVDFSLVLKRSLVVTEIFETGRSKPTVKLPRSITGVIQLPQASRSHYNIIKACNCHDVGSKTTCKYVALKLTNTRRYVIYICIHVRVPTYMPTYPVSTYLSIPRGGNSRSQVSINA